MTTIGVGIQSQQQALDALTNMTENVQAISYDEYLQRIEHAQTYMKQHNIAAIYLNAGTNLTYFTGMKWYASERMVGAILPAEGGVQFIAPTFEVGTLLDYQVVKGPIHTWQEHESPYKLFATVLVELGITDKSVIGIDESTAFFIFDGIRQAAPQHTWVNADQVTAYCRMHKSVHELSLIQCAMDMTLSVHQATASMLHEGITTTEVEAFINAAHKKVGATGNYFCIVLFGEASSFPHGVKEPQTLKQGDVVLVDTGCKVEGYLSDITRTYVFGTPSQRQRTMWQHEKNAQVAAFNAAQIGKPCGAVDDAARNYLTSVGLGPDYNVPGCPHRTGHGIGLDIHEWPYLVRNNPQPLQAGMCFSNEPMLVIPDEFGIRLEDHFYMTEAGPRWFTQPSYSIDDPFGLNT